MPLMCGTPNSIVTDQEDGCSVCSGEHPSPSSDKMVFDLKELNHMHDPPYFLYREYIAYGYRAHPNMNAMMCTKSMFTCHCETTNIWTHLLPALYFLAQLILAYNPSLSETYNVLQNPTSHNLLCISALC